MEALNLQNGIYAITGANGSGKSTLFRVLMSCDSNEKSVDLHSSIRIATEGQCHTDWDEGDGDGNRKDRDPCGEGEGMDTAEPFTISMPSSDVIEISQSFYWPLYTKPMDWMFPDDFLTTTRTTDNKNTTPKWETKEREEKVKF